MTCAVRTNIRMKFIMVSQAYSTAESKKLPTINWIWLFVHTFNMTVLLMCSIVSLLPLIYHTIIRANCLLLKL